MALRIGISALIEPERAGGAAQALAGLIYGLGKLTDRDEKYIIFTKKQVSSWLDSYLGPNQSIIPFEGSCRPVRKFGRLYPSKSDGYLESHNLDVLYIGDGVINLSSIPTVYNPHDLQHLHFSEFFSGEERKRRTRFYRDACKHAKIIATPSKWVKNDVSKKYRISQEKIWAIPWACSTDFYPSLSDDVLNNLRRKVPQKFVFFPAQTWPHKNHIRLLEAIAFIRDNYSVKLNLVCVGHQNDYWEIILKRLKELRLEEQVNFLGFVSQEELLGLYYLCQFMVFPSLFEGGGIPVLEAFKANVPVTCSEVASLPEWAGEAALYFDPYSITSIAKALLRMATDEKLCGEQRNKGTKQIKCFSWMKTARSYRALFRRVAGEQLHNDDLLMEKECVL